MKALELWIVRRYLRKQVIQGYDHHVRIAGLYQLIRDAAEAEFTEDNAPTLSSFLAECFESTQVWLYRGFK